MDRWVRGSRFWRRSATSEELRHIEIETKELSVVVGHGGKASEDNLHYLLPGQILDGGGKVPCRRTIHGWSPGEVIATALSQTWTEGSKQSLVKSWLDEVIEQVQAVGGA